MHEQNLFFSPRIIIFPHFTSNMAGVMEENKLTPEQDFNFEDGPKHVLIVMDALKEFSIEPLEWTLKNVALKSCSSVTIIGTMPWLNIPRTHTYSSIFNTC